MSVLLLSTVFLHLEFNYSVLYSEETFLNNRPFWIRSSRRNIPDQFSFVCKF